MITIYKVEHEGSYCVLFSLENAIDFIQSEIEDNYSKDESALEYNLLVCEATEEELEKLPEFEGF